MNSLNAIKSCLTLYLWYMEQTNETCKQPDKAIENGKIIQKVTIISGVALILVSLKIKVT